MSARLSLLALIIVLAPATAFGQWQPLPTPEEKGSIAHESLFDTKTVDLTPGSKLVVTPERLRAIRIQIEDPALYGYLRFEEVFESPDVEASLATKPIRLGDRDLLIRTELMTRSKLAIRYASEAPRPLQISAHSIESIEPYVYWEWWQRELLEWVAGGAEGAPPEGVGIGEKATVYQGLQSAGQLVRMIDELANDQRHNEVTKWLAVGLVLKSIEEVRQPRFRYFSETTITTDLADAQQPVRVDTGSFSNEAIVISRGVPEVLAVRGPGIVRFGVRAIKEADSPDSMSRYRLTFRENGRRIHDQRFSSRAARLDSDDIEETDEPTATQDSANFVTASNGKVVGWRRTSQFWLPPGDHQIEMTSDGADVLFDAQVHRPKYRVESYVVDGINLADALEKAEARLGQPRTITELLLKLELLGLLNRFDEAELLLEVARNKADSTKVEAWLDMREARWFEPDVTRLEPLMQRAIRDGGSPANRSWALASRAVELERYASAAELLAFVPLNELESPEQAELRALAGMKGLIDRAARWEAFETAYQTFQARPLDADLRRRVQRIWWNGTYWDNLSSRSGELMLLPMGERGEVVAREQIASRKSLLFEIPRSDEYRAWAPAAPDVPERMRRLRIAAYGESPEEIHELRIDGTPYPILRDRRLQFFDFAVESARAYSLGSGPGRLLSTEVPDHLVDIPAHEVFEPHRVPLIEKDAEFTWELPHRATTRFVRLNFLIEADAPSRIEVDTGIGEVRQIEFRGSPKGQTWVRAFIKVDPGANELTLKPRGASVRASAEVRQPRGIPDRIPINVEVDLPPDQARLLRLQKLSRSLSLKENPALRVERAEILMSLDQDKLARSDLERVLAASAVPVELRATTERLHAAVKIRLSSEWYELGPQWLDGRVAMPADLGAAFVPDDLQCEAQDCARVKYRLARSEEDAAKRIEHWEFLSRTIDGHRWLFASKMAREAINLIESGPDQAPVGLAAEIYGKMREVMQVFPSDRNRARWYGALRWSRWESVSTASGGSFLAEFEPPRGPINAEELDLPRMNDPVSDSVERALSGTDWSAESTYPMFGFHRRVIRFQPFDSGTLDLQNLCFDTRPDLQPTGAPEPCRFKISLEGPGGSMSPQRSGSRAPGRISSTRWQVNSGERYKLTVERLDGLLGRTHWIRPMIHRPSEASIPVVRRVRRGTDILPSGTPARLTVQGPVVVRIDVRGISPDPSPGVDVFVDGEKQSTIGIDPLEQDGAEMMSQSLTRATRQLLWLERDKTYDLEFRSAPGFATVRVALRVDDYDALLRPSGKGWFEPEPVEPDEGFEPAVASDFVTRLDPVDLLNTPWIYGLLAGTRLASPALNLVEEVDRDTANPVLQVEAGAYLRALDWLWLDSRLNARTRFEGSPAAGMELDAYARLPWWRLRGEVESTGWLQPVSNVESSGRLELRLSRPTSLPGDWLFLPSMRAIGRTQSLDQDEELADVVIFNDYAKDHPLTFDLQLAVWFRPFVNAMAAAEIQPVFNQNASLDQVRFDLSARTLIESTELEAEYGIRFLAVDDDRFQAYLFHDIDFEAALGYWLVGGHLLTFDASTRFTIAPRTNALFRFRFGVGFTYWFSPHGLKARPSSELIYDDLLEPRYFLD